MGTRLPASIFYLFFSLRYLLSRTRPVLAACTAYQRAGSAQHWRCARRGQIVIGKRRSEPACSKQVGRANSLTQSSRSARLIERSLALPFPPGRTAYSRRGGGRRWPLLLAARLRPFSRSCYIFGPYPSTRANASFVFGLCTNIPRCGQRKVFGVDAGVSPWLCVCGFG